MMRLKVLYIFTIIMDGKVTHTELLFNDKTIHIGKLFIFNWNYPIYSDTLMFGTEKGELCYNYNLEDLPNHITTISLLTKIIIF